MALATTVAALVAGPALAANHYVRAGAAGANTGADWSNAWPQLPASLVRGDVYYVAAGVYPAHTFNDPQSGTLTITVKKATEADHGIATGWQTAYGTGQASFASVLRFQRSHYVFDGQVRNEANWFDGAAYGFVVRHNNQDQNIVITNYGVSLTNISIKHVYVDAIVGNLPSATIRRYAIDTDGFDGGSTATGLLFHRMYVKGSNNVWFLRTTDGAIVEYSASDGAVSSSSNHGEIVNLYYSGNNAIIRFNRFRNAFKDSGGGGTAIVAITYADGLQFYGNVVSSFSVGDGSVGFDGASSSHNRVYNNTFVDCSGYNAGTAWGSGTDNIERNNLFINCPTVNLAGSHDYNGFSGTNTRGEANAQVNLTTSIFQGYSTGNFALQSPTAAGVVLAAPFNVDLLGRVRGADGVADRGALEFSPNLPAPPAAPTNLRLQ